MASSPADDAARDEDTSSDSEASDVEDENVAKVEARIATLQTQV